VPQAVKNKNLLSFEDDEEDQSDKPVSRFK